MYKIYKITNIVNDKIYIGKTSKTIDERLKKHFSSINENMPHPIPIREAIKKYGKRNFIIELITETECKKTAGKIEEYEISRLQSYKEENGYNVAKGNTGGDTLSNHRNLSLIKLKLSNSKMGVNNPLSKSVILKDGENILEFGSTEECKRFLEKSSIKIASSSIKRKCNGIIKNNKIDKYIVSWKKV